MALDQFVSNNQEGTNFREIILSHLKKILDISSNELRQKTTVKFNPNGEQIKEEEDTRESYIQSVEALAIVLLPYFDEEMTKVYQECEKILFAYNYELKKLFSKEIENFEEQSQADPTFFYIRLRINHAKKLFKELNLLLKRQGYLKGAIFGEEK